MPEASQSDGFAWEFMPMRYGKTFWELRVPHFYGTVEDAGDKWIARRSGDERVPPVGCFADVDDAKALVESWAAEHLRWLVRTGMDQAAGAQRVLAEVQP